MAQSDAERYQAALHAVQSGVELSKQHNPRELEPKQLRVGVNAAMCDHAALARLLLAKGIITEDEYTKAIADEMEREQARYEEKLSRQIGGEIHLA